MTSNLLNGNVPSTYEVYKLSAPPYGTTKDALVFNEVYDGPTLQTQHPQAATFYWYPWLHLLSDGQFFMAGFAKRGGMARRHDPMIPTQWNMGVGALPNPPYLYGDFAYAHYGSSVLLPINFNALSATRDRVLRMGGRLGGPGTLEGSQSVYLDDVDECSPLGGTTAWQKRSALDKPRKFANAVLLPDESILVVGGQNAWGPVYDAERLVGEDRVKAGTMDSVRDYHSIALLLPDGRVFVGGGNNRDYDYQIYAPPYLFAGPRPVITGWLATPPPAPSPELDYGETFTVDYTLAGTSAYAAKVVLMRPGSTTHHFDSEQRLLQLQHIHWPPPVEGTLQVQAPPNSTYAPKGYYMLFVVTNTGVPSVATWVKLQ